MIIIIVITYIVVEVRPIWKQYEKSGGENSPRYRNEKLDVELEIRYRSDIFDVENDTYIASWDGERLSGNSAEELMDRISLCSGQMSENQYKWFEYILTHVVE